MVSHTKEIEHQACALSASEPACSEQDRISAQQHLNIIAEYNGLEEPLSIGCNSINTRHHELYMDGPSFLERMKHINQLIIEDLNC